MYRLFRSSSFGLVSVDEHLWPGPGELIHPLCGSRCETEAESVAYLVCDALGIASDQYSFVYVASWSPARAAPRVVGIATLTGDLVEGGDDVVGVEAEKAMRCAREILADLHPAIADDLAERDGGRRIAKLLASKKPEVSGGFSLEEQDLRT